MKECMSNEHADVKVGTQLEAVVRKIQRTPSTFIDDKFLQLRCHGFPFSM